MRQSIKPADVRQVRPELNSGSKTHCGFNNVGNYLGRWLMEIDLKTVRRVFRDVLHGRMTREAADRWAYGVIQQSEAGSLTYSPVTAEDRIWECVMFLYGIDTMDAPGQYLHTEEDIRSFMVAKLES